MTTREKRLARPTGEDRLGWRMPSPFGEVSFTVDGAGALVGLDFEGGRGAPGSVADWSRRWGKQGLRFSLAEGDEEPVRAVVAELERYFAGDSVEFDLAVAPTGTAFQLEVWRALLDIPSGQTRSYGDLAHTLGRDGASRAVGRANGTNPVSLVIPCHRVIGADGSLTGYGGGTKRKRALLEHEGALQDAWGEGLGG